MKRSLRILLDFQYPSAKNSDDLVRGHGKVFTWTTGELPRIGERLYLISRTTEINMAIDDYDIRVVDIGRALGGDYTQDVICEVVEPQRNRWTGKLWTPTPKTVEKVVEDWTRIMHNLKENFCEDAQEGAKVIMLTIEGTLLA